MNLIFNNIPLPRLADYSEYDCGSGAYMLKFGGATKNIFDEYCKELELLGYSVTDSCDICGNSHKTYRKGVSLHTYFCESEGIIRVIADPYTADYQTSPDCGGNKKTTLWQFEVDHSLIDCGMCYAVRASNGKLFVIDSAHTYSVNDDLRIIEFLKKISGENKPVVAGWFFSHAHEDHVAKFLDIVEYHKKEITVETVYYNFPSLSHNDSGYWGEAGRNYIRRFDRVMNENPEIKKVKIHTGQRFFIGDVEFTVICTHEDIFPGSLCDFNNSSAALMMAANGSKVLIPGDCSALSDKVLVRRYKDYLKCDVVQMSHHGHSGTSPDFYRYADAPCVLFPITEIKFDEELPRQESNRVAIALSKEYHIASNGIAEIDLPYVYGTTKIWPDETFEDFNGIYNLWAYEYTEERKAQLRADFEKRKLR